MIKRGEVTNRGEEVPRACSLATDDQIEYRSHLVIQRGSKREKEWQAKREVRSEAGEGGTSVV